MAKRQFNFRLSDEASEIIDKLVLHFSFKNADDGRPATQAMVIERAVRALAVIEKISPTPKKKK
jgi:hypothetical protein